MADRIGTEIAGYRIESLIARGGMGEVYLATQSFPERKVALKLLPRDLASDQAFRERFIRESNAAASVEHPNIVPVYGAGDAEGELYIAMRYVQGEDLRSLLDREGPLSPDRAVRICSQIAEALEEAHEHGLVHRDVKPGNILISKGDRAYLTDFGLIRRSKLETDLTKTGQFMGTVDYVAPEQIKGDEVDGRADIYSLGCVLYECLVGVPPFRKDTEVATLYAHLEDVPPMLSAKRPELPRELDATIAKAMAKKPDDRFATAGKLAAAVRGSVVVAPAAGPSRPSAAGRRGRLAVLAGAGLAGIIALALWLGQTESTSPDRQGAAGPPLGSVIAIDPSSGKVMRTVEDVVLISQSGSGVVVGEGGVWISTGPNLVHLDSATGEEQGTVPFATGNGGVGRLPIDVGFRTVWVGAPPGLVRVNPATDKPLRPTKLEPGATVGAATLVSAGEGAVWAVQSNAVVKVNGSTGLVEDRILDVGSPTDIAVGSGGVWVLDALTAELTEIDPTTDRIIAHISLPGSPREVEAGAVGVWVLDADTGTVTEVDPESGGIGKTARVGADSSDLETGLGAVWVAGFDGTITKIDPVTRAVTEFSIGSPISALAVDAAGDTLWAVVAKRVSG